MLIGIHWFNNPPPKQISQQVFNLLLVIKVLISLT